jgi:hypothetical protein
MPAGSALAQVGSGETQARLHHPEKPADTLPTPGPRGPVHLSQYKLTGYGESISAGPPRKPDFDGLAAPEPN